MADAGIVVDGVWKRFHRGELHDSLRDLVPATLRRVLGRGKSASELGSDDFWALRAIGFEVKPGEAVGVIGQNGAGKSTLLKLINRILRPTRGSVIVRGRAGALIEVSAGFHPDLTGRENVYLQAAILGMRQKEVQRSFDEIVQFAGLEEFIDTPVKRYSSGMNARLGFAVAVHLRPEVLIIDEVLSVGDFWFQARAFTKLAESVRGGVPVIVVSHQLDRIKVLCERAIVLARGQVVFDGKSSEAILRYVQGETSTGDPSVGRRGDLRGLPRERGHSPCFQRIEVLGRDGVTRVDAVVAGAPITVKISFLLERAAENVDVGIAFDSMTGERLCGASTLFQPGPSRSKLEGLQTYICEVESLPLLPGKYAIGCALAIGGRNVDVLPRAAWITLAPPDPIRAGPVPTAGIFLLKHRWERSAHPSLTLPESGR